MRTPRGDWGKSLVEVLFVLSIAAIVGTSVLGSYLTARDEARGRGAARALALRIAAVRLDALRRGATSGLVFRGAGSDVTLQFVVDGNGNGLRNEEVTSGLDRSVGPPFHLSDEFAGVRFGVVEDTPPVDGDGAGLTAGDDPIQIGSSSFLAFGPSGSGSSGTLYLTGPGRRQFAVRVFGPTGRVRVFEFLPGVQRWVSP